MSIKGVGDCYETGGRGGVALGLAFTCLLISASCSEDADRAKGIRAALTSPDAAVPEPPSLQAAPPAGQQATWVNLWGSWPAARYQHAAAYDIDRKIIVMYGGQSPPNVDYFDDTWEWNDMRGSWIQRANNGSVVGTRSGHSMVYDPVAKKTFLFGGWQPAASFYIPGQWHWDPVGSAWVSRATTSPEPDPRRDHAMVYDSDRNKIVLFGGFGGPGADAANKARLNDVWEWDSTAGVWGQPTITGTRPVARFGHTMAYDASRKRIVMRGGNTGTGTGSWVNETWELDPAAGTWKPLVTTGAVPVYNASAGYDHIAYDASRQKTVLYETPDYIYELDPVTPTWNKIVPTRIDTTGPASVSPVMLYDPLDATIVLFAGQSGRTRDLWELDGANLTLTTRSIPTSGPVQRQFPALAYDSMRGKLMLFGGYNPADTSGAYKQDTWEWSGTDATWLFRTNAGTKPDPRYYAGMAYDSKRDRLLLYGGASGAGSFDDLWQWLPTTQTWSQITFAAAGTRPTARSNFWLFYDAARDKLIVFGYSGTPAQIWEYDPVAGTWKDRTPVPFPTGVNRSYAEMTFDSDRGKVVMVGGYVGAKYTTEVWEWDTTTGIFAQRLPAAGSLVPVGRYYHAVSYDSGRRVVLLVGGYGNDTGITTPINDSWEWDGTTATWTETTPATVVPLPRYNHLLTYDSKGGTTFLFGGTVPLDTTYGPQEIWQYFPNSTPRPNGSACSSATASSCMSGKCVDGVCCASASCPGTCQACNVPGASLGTCANVAAGTPDDSCAADQACDANHLCKSRNGLTCASYSDCASGQCVDGFCCDTACTDTCKACNLATKRGVCSNISAGIEDPSGAPPCLSDSTQPRYCDGNGTCTNAPKPIGSPCTAPGQCAAPSQCIDGVCCNSACNQTCYSCTAGTTPGTCTALAAGFPDHSATTPCEGVSQYCASGVCMSNKKPVGATGCSTGADCGSGFCVDTVCCNSACLGTCQGCNVPGKVGTCVNLAGGSPDNFATVTCALPQYCDTAGTCQSGAKANGIPCGTGSECYSGKCVDGVCCLSDCTGNCMACNVPTLEGTCSSVPPGGNDAPGCLPPNYCGSSGCTTGKKPNGASCTLGNECGSSNCIDSTCCENSCVGTCLTCKNSTGSCILTPAGQDPRKNCGAGDCAGTCDGQGVCNFPASGKVCGKAGCAGDGVIHKPGTCDGSGNCTNDRFNDCNGFRCYTDPADGMDKCATSCAADPNCQDPNFCDNTAKCLVDYPNGHACDRDTECLYNHCAIPAGATTGVCCNRDCRTCGTCNLPGQEGTCVPTPADTDPNHDCIDSASDPSGVCGGKCNGQWGCQFPPAGKACGTCKVCDGASKCNVMPEDDVMCGVIDCDGLDTDCRDYHDLQIKRCASLGTCKAANSTTVCTDVTVTCQPDAGGTGGATGATDGAVDDAGTDAPAPPKSGGGGCGCDLGAGRRGGDPAGLLGALFIAGFFVAGRRRGRRR